MVGCAAVAGCAVVGRDVVVGCAVVGRDVVVGCAVVRCAVVGRDAGNLYLKQGKSAKWVEKPSSACRESLPKQPFLLGKGRDSKPPPTGNLYLKQGNPAKWVEKPGPACRESLPKTVKAGEMGRETKPHLPEISTQNRENRRRR